MSFSGWDMHGAIVPGPFSELDHAIDAFLNDVAQRGLSETILLVITGDFGRNAQAQPRRT